MTTLNRVLCLSSSIPKNARYLIFAYRYYLLFNIFSLILEHICKVYRLFFRLFCSTSRTNADDGWFSKLLVRRIEPTKESHSRMLSDKDIVYALHTHNIRPDSVDKYLNN